MKRNLLAAVLTSLFILACTAFSLFAQTGIIKGTITDQFSKEALANVNIILAGTVFGSASSKSGEFEIANIQQRLRLQNYLVMLYWHRH